MMTHGLKWTITLVVLCSWISTNLAWCQTTQLTIDPTMSINTLYGDIMGMNIPRGVSSSNITHPDYQARINEISPTIIRLHSGIGKNQWLDGSQTAWDQTTITTVLNNLPQSTDKVLITIARWPAWMNKTDGSDQLDTTYFQTYANLCASLVTLVNDTLGKNIVYWEPFNEADGLYDTQSQIQEMAFVFQLASQAMQAADSDIKIVGGAWRWGSDWKIRVFLDELTTGDLDIWSHHTYNAGSTNTDPQAIYDKTSNLTSQIDVARNYLDTYGHADIPIWVDEYNIFWDWDEPGYWFMTDEVGAVHDALCIKGLQDQKLANALMTWNDAEPAFGKFKSDFSQLNPGGYLYQWLLSYACGTEVASTSSAEKLKIMAIKTGDTSLSCLLVNRDTISHNVYLSHTDWEPYAIHAIDSNGVNIEPLTSLEYVNIPGNSVWLVSGKLHNQPDSLTANASFESSNDSWTGFDSQVLHINSHATDGSYATQLNYASGKWPGISQTQHIIPGRQYRVSCTWEGDNVPANGTIRLTWKDISGRTLKSQYVCSTGTGTFGPTYHQATVTMPKDAVTIDFKAYINSGVGGTMYLDNIRCDLLEQVIANPDFEQSSGAWAGIESSTLITLDHTSPYSGKSAVKITYQNNKWPGVSQTVDIQAGKAYEMSCFWKGESITANSTIRIKWLDDMGQQIGSSQYVCSSPTGTFDYLQSTTTKTAPTGAVQLNLWAYANSGTGTIYLDNLTCKEQ